MEKNDLASDQVETLWERITKSLQTLRQQKLSLPTASEHKGSADQSLIRRNLSRWNFLKAVRLEKQETEKEWLVTQYLKGYDRAFILKKKVERQQPECILQLL